MPSRNLGHRAPLLWIVLPLMAGLIAGRAELPLGAVRFQLACALGVSALALWAAWRERPVWGASVVVAMFLAGAASYTLHRARLRVWDALPPREARLTLQIERTFPRPDQRSVSGLGIVCDADSHLRDLSGQPLYFSLQMPKGAAVPLRSAVVTAVGLLITLPPNAPPNTSMATSPARA